jgi:hypothetical protein
VKTSDEFVKSEHRLEDRVEPNMMNKYLTGRFTDFKDFDVNRVPNWNLQRQVIPVCFKSHLYRIEGKKDYKKFISRQEENS